MSVNADLPIQSFPDQKKWEQWLSRNVGSDGLWLKLAKGTARTSTLTYQQALEIALCYGWIDGQKKAFDDAWWLQRFGPRKLRSIWSQINRAKAEQLIKDDRMTALGLAAVENAKRNGQWDRAYQSQKVAEPPADFRKALKAAPRAEAFFESLDSRNRYSILFRIQSAKKPETRAARIEKFVEMLRRHEKISP